MKSTLLLVALFFFFGLSVSTASFARRQQQQQQQPLRNGFENEKEVNPILSLLPHDHPDMVNAEPGTVIQTGVHFGPFRASLVKLPQANRRKEMNQRRRNKRSILTDVDVQSDFQNNRYPNQFAPQLINWLNTVNQQTYQGVTLNIVQAEILGFPPTPIPTSGHVTHDFMTEMGGLNFTLDSVSYGTLVPFLAPYGYSSAFLVNDANATQTHDNTYSQQVTSTYTTSFTSGFNFGFTESVTVGVPAVDSETSTISMQWSFSTTQTSSYSTTNTVSDTTTVSIPPNSAVNVTCYVEMGNLNTNFTAFTHLSPNSNVGWVFQDAQFYPPGQAWFWMFQTYQTISGMQYVGGYFNNSLDYQYVATGTFGGVAGNTCQCYIYQCPYSPGINQCIGNSSTLIA